MLPPVCATILRENLNIFHEPAYCLGFWGWPLPQPDAAERAARTALAIRKQFEQVQGDPTHALANFRVGLGIASGWAVAGRIGTTDQVKITAFGPAVNLAARLESMTKQVNAPILTDEATASTLKQTDLRVRCLARAIFGV